ncbi:MAG: 4-hydroxy-3-methylbut-2-enyl diphosphate reductase, partial [Pedobacter sp.]
TNGKAIVFQDLAELDELELPNKITLYSQTTKSTDKFYQIKDELLKRGFDLKANDTICRQVSNRYEDLENFVADYDKIIFVSGKKSSNGKVLYDVCKKYNPNSYFISNVDELDKTWFATNDKIGICGATSTPMWLMEQIKSALENLS